MKNAFSGLIGELFRPARSPEIKDETVGSFITRRANASVKDNLVSAVLHGIYAGDVDQLSAKTLFPKEWRNEAAYGSISRAALKMRKPQALNDVVFRNQVYFEIKPNMMAMEHAVMFTLANGMGALVDTLRAELEGNPNITIKTSSPVSKIDFDPETLTSKIHHGGSDSPFEASHIISTLYAPYTSSLLPTPIPALAAIPASTVLVVNLYYPTPQLLPKSLAGFGYLIPKSVAHSENPHSALGVLFDTNTTTPTQRKKEPGTKLTVMLGGHYWSNPSHPMHSRIQPNSPNPISDAEAVQMAVDTLKLQLGRRYPEVERELENGPEVTNVALQRNAIPQYTVGHEERLVQADEDLRRLYKGRVAVVGSSYKGVGVSDCVRMAREEAGRVARYGEGTGLGDVVRSWIYKIRA